MHDGRIALPEREDGERSELPPAGLECRRSISLTGWVRPVLVRAALFSTAGALAFSGCTMVGPNFVKPEAPVAAQWGRADDAFITRDPAELAHWWAVFKDPVLDRLIETAYRNNYNVQIAGLRVLQARAELGIAVGTLYPQQQQAIGDATYSSASKNAANTAAGDLSFWTYKLGGNVTWELDFWGRFHRAIESADASLLGSIAAYDNVLVLLLSQVADTYLVIRTAEEQLRVAEENVAIQRRSVEITDVRYRNGDTDELDVLQARAQLLATQATIPQLQIGLQQARNALSTLLGRPPGNLADVLGNERGAIPQPPAKVAAGAPADLLRRRPDVQQAELAAAAQSAQVGIAEADLYPSFGLSGFLGVVAADGTDTTRTRKDGVGRLFNANSLGVAAGPYFSWNVLNYGRIKDNVRAQDAVLQQLLVNYQNTVLSAAQEVEDGIASFRLSLEQERILAANVEAAQRALRLSTIRYREGYADFQRVLDAQTSLLAATQRLVSARSGVARSVVSVYRALGGGWEIRTGQDFVNATNRETMQKRVDWGDLLQPEAIAPKPATPASWPSPDW